MSELHFASRNKSQVRAKADSESAERKPFPPYSVLMSVYEKELPEYLNESFQSMFNQTAPPDDFVLICDGPMTAGLDAVIDHYLAQYPDVLRVIRLKNNTGLGRVLNTGLARCKNELVARMDSDDIAFPDRCEKQLAMFEKDNALDVVGGWIEEFAIDPAASFSMRRVPEANDAIVAFASIRCPFNHPTVMFKRDRVLSLGGYKDIPLCEDYDLWGRMLIARYKTTNLQEPLVWMRTSQEMLQRRKKHSVHRARKNIKRQLLKQGMMSRSKYLFSMMLDTAIAYAPLGMMSWATQRLLRHSKQSGSKPQ